MAAVAAVAAAARVSSPVDAAHRRTFRSIQYLRALAALAVVVFHATERAGHPVAIGAAGVDVCFVVSGFVMFVTTSRRDVAPGQFLLHRAIRIVPAYWAVTLSMVALAAAFPLALPNLRAPFDHLALSLLFVPHSDTVGAPYPVLVAGWTLTYEAGFYLVFAAALLVRPSRRLLAATATLGTLVAGGVLLHPDGQILRAYTNPLLMEFAVGLWLGWAAITGGLPSRQWGAGLLAAGMAAFMVQSVLPNTGEDWRPLLWGGPAMLVVAGALSLETQGMALRAGHRAAGLMLALGDASYAIYLLHGLVVSACARLVPGASAPMLAAMSVTAASAVGLAFYAFAERPVTQALRRLFTAPRVPSPLVQPVYP